MACEFVALGRGYIPALLIAMATVLAPPVASANELGDWLKDREARFKTYRVAHPNPDAAISGMKAKVAAQIAAWASSTSGANLLDQTPRIWPLATSPIELWDGADYPEMIVIPPGEYTMGSVSNEADRRPDEGDRQRVRIDYPFAVSEYPITVGQFDRFVQDSHYSPDDGCFTPEEGDQPKHGRNWRVPSFKQSLADPVVCMNWTDAQAYVAWLSTKTGHIYRLLSEAEYEYATRAGSATRFWWGNAPDEACSYANGVDLDAVVRFPGWKATNCHDGYVFTSPVGHFKPNQFGLYDMAGNAWSWLSDCWPGPAINSRRDVPVSDCERRALRGGSWGNGPADLRSAARYGDAIRMRGANYGFRVARTL
jgi:formylglycine-generating enzyme required for sulfatase activity